MKEHVNLDGRREGGRRLLAMYVANLRLVEIPADGGTMVKLDKPMAAITTADVKAIRAGWKRQTSMPKAGRYGPERALKRLRHMCTWAIKAGHVKETPFRQNGVAVIDFLPDVPRSRRLGSNEEQRLLAAASAVDEGDDYGGTRTRLPCR